jgi:nitrogen regulatory protein PII
MTYVPEAVLSTAVVRRGEAEAGRRAARDMGASGGIVHLARGTDARERLGLLGIAVEAEKQVINIVVAADHQDLIARAVYQAAEMHAPGGGYLYLTPLEKLATFIPQAALERARKPG